MALLLALAACASQPEAERDVRYEQYWQCAYSAAMQNAANGHLSAWAVARRAQADCYDAFVRYQRANQHYSRSVVTSDGRTMATRIADAGAAQRRKHVTTRLARLVVDARD